MKKSHIKLLKSKFGDRYVYIDSKGKHHSVKADKATINQFKDYINNRGYEVGYEVYSAKSANIRHYNAFSEIESKKKITRGSYTFFRIAGKCDYQGKTYYGFSPLLLKKHIKEALEEEKNIVISNIAYQILSEKLHYPSISGKNELSEKESSKFEYLSQYVSSNTEFYYKYERS